MINEHFRLSDERINELLLESEDKHNEVKQTIFAAINNELLLRLLEKPITPPIPVKETPSDRFATLDHEERGDTYETAER
jgi:hypothetical protein